MKKEKRSQRSEIEAELFLAAFFAGFYSRFDANKTKGIFLVPLVVLPLLLLSVCVCVCTYVGVVMDTSET